MEEFKPVVFRIGEQKFGIDINKIKGIEKEQVVIPVPNTVDYITGIINLRGDVIPVYSLKRKFNIHNAENKDPQYIITWVKDSVIAFEVDGVDEIHNVDEANIHEVPSIIGSGETGYISKVINSKNDLIIIIDIDKILTEEELGRVGDLVNNQ